MIIFLCLSVSLPQKHEQKSRHNSQNIGDKIFNKVTTSLRLIIIDILTAQKNLSPPHAWELRFVHSSL